MEDQYYALIIPAIAALAGATWGIRSQYGPVWTLGAALASAVVASLFAGLAGFYAILMVVGMGQAGTDATYAGLALVIIAGLCGSALGLALVAVARRSRVAKT